MIRLAKILGANGFIWYLQWSLGPGDSDNVPGASLKKHGLRCNPVWL